MQLSIELCECGGSPVDVEGETVCGSCGIVVENAFPDFGPEMRAFNQAERDRRTRTGMALNPAIHDKGLSTMVGKGARDSLGRKIPHLDRIKMRRLRKWNIRSRVHGSKDRNLAQAMGILDQLCDGLTLPSIIRSEAAVIYRRTLGLGLTRGRSIEMLVAGSVYVAIRLASLPRTLKDVVSQTSYSKKDVSRCYRLILKELNLKMPVPDGKIHLTKIADKLGLSQKVQRDAFDLLTEAKAERLTQGKAPVGLASAAIYISCRMNGENVTQCQISEAANVTEVTIRNRYKAMVEGLGIDDSVLASRRGRT